MRKRKCLTQLAIYDLSEMKKTNWIQSKFKIGLKKVLQIIIKPIIINHYINLKLQKFLRKCSNEILINQLEIPKQEIKVKLLLLSKKILGHPSLKKWIIHQVWKSVDLKRKVKRIRKAFLCHLVHQTHGLLKIALIASKRKAIWTLLLTRKLNLFLRTP